MSILQESDMRARVSNELRLGLPIRLVISAEQQAAVLAAELVNPRWLDALRHASDNQVILALSRFRAETLRVRCYDDDMARVPVTDRLNAPLIAAIADPSRDLEQPMKGPFESLRDGDVEIARLGLGLVRTAGLLPAVLITAPNTTTESVLEGTVAITSTIAVAPAPATAPTRISSAKLPLAQSENTVVTLFRDPASGDEHLALEIGTIDRSRPIWARVHSSCYTGDVLNSLRCDCGPQLSNAVAELDKAGGGIVVLLQQEGRGIGLANKMRAYALQDQGFDTFEANRRLGFADDERSFAAAAAILRALGYERIRLLSDNPHKTNSLVNAGIDVVERIPHTGAVTPHNVRYLAAKARRNRDAA